MSRPKRFQALWRYHRDALDVEGIQRRRDDIKALWALGPAHDVALVRERIKAWWAGDRPERPPLVDADLLLLASSYARHLRASALAAYIYGVAAVICYVAVLWQLWAIGASSLTAGAWPAGAWWLTAAVWALASAAFTLRSLSAAAWNWQLRGGKGGIGAMLDGPGPRWPRLRV